MQNIKNNKLAKAVSQNIKKKADIDIVSLQGIIDDLTKILEMCYSEECDPVHIADRIGFVIDDLEGWKPYVTNNIKSSTKKKAAYPFYEMVKDNSPLYQPNDPIGVQSDDNDLNVNFKGVNFDTDFEQAGYFNQYGLNNVDEKELEMGIKVEMEHTTNKEIAKRIALDHLTEISNYYTLLKEMEDKAKETGTFNKNIEGEENE